MTKTVAITRSPADAEEFLNLAADGGIRAHALPTIQLVSRGSVIADEFLRKVAECPPDYTVFMSSKAVSLLAQAAREESRFEELRLAVANTTVVAVGPKTRASLEDLGIRVNHMPPKTYSSVGVGELFTTLGAVGSRVMVPRSGASTPFLRELLGKIGLEVIELHLYDVCTHGETAEWTSFRGEFYDKQVDGIVFTSASSVRAFFDMMSKDYDMHALLMRLEPVCLVAIGPFTAAELARFGVRSTVSQVHTVKGAFDAVKNELR